MPYHDEEYPGQPLWQSVLLFCCKGMIEGIMVILFFWLLVQVLFTKQLEVHLQILLMVGLIVFCLCLILGCIMCWRKSKICPLNDKEPVTSTPAEPVTLAQSPPLSATTAVARQQYEELDGDIMEYPSTFSSPAPSHHEFSSLPFSSRAHVTSEWKEHPKSYFSLRRLSTPPLTSPLYKPIDNSHTSLPTLPKLGLLSKTRKVLERRCTVTGDSISYTERSRLTSTGAGSPSLTEDPIPLAPLTYGSSASCRQPASPIPCLHFTMAFSPEQQTLTVTILSLTGTPHRLEDVSVLGSLPPLYPCPIQASTQRSLSLEPYSLMLVLKVSSVKELQRCVLRITLYTRELQTLKGSTLGELEAQCGGKDWKADHPLHFTKELSPNKWMLKKSVNSQDALMSKGLSCPPQILGQLFIVLQYQNLVHRIKAMVLRGDNLASLTHMPAAPDYHLMINLRHEGVVIGTRESKGGSNTVWNTPFLFDLPPGDVSQLPLMMEFIIMQDQAHSKSTVLGRVLIGSEAPEAGRAHWRDMCSQGQVERARWHTIQPEPL
ncbi:synaptotagmin-4-like [Myripristis murdjan]|uniref:synaptotagmin-4-like n=1 Tax=Myripristis murdjan TaxID=586833 RepID=UPI00117635FD|nr:synaptotagmin-4-like [Myripristis murdjan]